jgi:hypothetical protein
MELGGGDAREIAMSRRSGPMKRFMNGTKTPDEVFRSTLDPCHVCRRPGAIRILVWMSFEDFLTKADAAIVAAIRLSFPDGQIPTTPMRSSRVADVKPHVKIADQSFCDHCKRDAERAAARGPSEAIVHIERGPDPKNRVAFGLVH